MNTWRRNRLGLLICLGSIVIAGACAPVKQRDEATLASGIKAAVTIDATETGAPISKYIYGQFIEHLGRCIYGGIWAEMLEDRKFYYPISDDYQPWSVVRVGGRKIDVRVLTGSPWKVVGGAGSVRMVTENSYVGEHTPEIQLPGGGASRGIEHGELALIKGKGYTGRIVIAGSAEAPPQGGTSPTGSGAAPIKVSLIWGDGRRDRQTVMIAELNEDYARTPLSFTAGATTEEGRLEIVGLGKGAFRIGAISLMPADNINGLRADTFRLLKELNAPVYRWPGGNFVSGYNWRDGIGDPDRRPPRKNPAWTGIEHNDFGLHEFMAFCRKLDAEPYIALNTGLGSVESAAQEVEYANDAPDTPLGRLRAENGHPEPFNVKWWAVGNEMYGSWQLGHMPLEEYVKKHNQCVEAIRAADPAARPVAVGSVGQWSEQMLTSCADHMDLIAEHFYLREKPDVATHVAQMPHRVREIAEAHRGYRQAISSLAGKDIRIAMDEWNYWYGDYVYGELGTRYYLKDALGVAAGLHEYFRQSDIIFMANYAQTVNVIGCIKTSKTAAAFATTALPLKLYREHFGVLPVTVSGVPEPLDIAAAWTEDHRALTVAVVNPTRTGYNLTVDFRGASPARKGRQWLIAGSDPMVCNEPGKAPEVVIEEQPLRGSPKMLTAPPLSVSLYRLPVR